MTASISINETPANNRVPGIYGEYNNSRASYFTQNLKSLIIGQSVNVITEEPVLVTSTGQAKTLFGVGSMIARMVAAYKANNIASELWVMPLNDVAGTKASSTVTFTGTATGSGTIFLYVAGVQTQVPVSIGDDMTAIAAKAVLKLNANVDLPILATSALGVLTLTAKNSGTVGNSIDISLNYYPDFEVLPAGVTAVISGMASGATDPVLTSAIATIGDTDFEYWINPYTDTVSLNVIRDELAGRHTALEMLYGHSFTSLVDTVAGLDTFGTTRNDQFNTIIGVYGTPTWPVEITAAYVAVAEATFSNDPADPAQTLEIRGIVPPKKSNEFTYSEKQTLLFSGITPLTFEGGIARVVRTITTYQQDAFGTIDPSYLDVNTMTTTAYVMRTFKQLFSSKFARVKLIDNGTRFGAGQNAVTANIVRSECVGVYGKLINLGICENMEAFKQNLIVTRNVNDPNRLDVLIVPDYVNQLRTLAFKNEFTLQTS